MTRTKALALAGGVLLGSTLAAQVLRARRAANLTDRVALVTGGSRGLGLLIARELGRQGVRVVLVARNQAELDRAEQSLHADGIEASTFAGDVSDEATAGQMVDAVVARHGAIDILVNNAGVISVGPIEHMEVADYHEAMAVHFWGPLHLIRAAVPFMRRQGGGRIVNISSIGGKMAVPHLAPYCASKFALVGLSNALTPELAQDGIVVTTVCPGLMRTGSFFNAWFKGKHREEFAWFAIADSLPLLSIDGRRAAAQVVDALRHGDAELVITWAAKLAVLASAVAPNTAARALDVVNRLLPRPSDESGNQRRIGWQSVSEWAPSRLTRLSEEAAVRNNEIPTAGALPVS